MGTITIMGALGGFSGPWAYKGSQTAQGYPDGQIATLSLFCASICAYIILWYAGHQSLSSNIFHTSSIGSLVDGGIPFELPSNQSLIS
jgi:hypothetical protein